jgi:hypothetical protein
MNCPICSAPSVKQWLLTSQFDYCPKCKDDVAVLASLQVKLEPATYVAISYGDLIRKRVEADWDIQERDGWKARSIAILSDFELSITRPAFVGWYRIISLSKPERHAYWTGTHWAWDGDLIERFA